MGLDISALVPSLAVALSSGLVVLKSDVRPSTGGGLSRMVEDLVLNTALSYQEMVAMGREEYPAANTSTKSVASVACVMRKKGQNVPLRLKLIQN